jgi:hypothetical protein
LRALTSKGALLSGEQIVGTEIQYKLSEGKKGKKKRVRFKSAQPLAPGADVWLYDLDIKDGNGSWRPLCETSGGARTEALLLGNVWDPLTAARVGDDISGLITFACRDAALAKCVECGYAPWRSADDIALTDHHQACTRPVRADYCGDGTPHTHDGTPVHLTDHLGVQKEDSRSPYAVEAEWGPGGAARRGRHGHRLFRYDEELDRRVAIKLVRRQAASSRRRRAQPAPRGPSARPPPTPTSSRSTTSASSATRSSSPWSSSTARPCAVA